MVKITSHESIGQFTKMYTR